MTLPARTTERGEAVGCRTPRPPLLQWLPLAVIAFTAELMLVRGLSGLGAGSATMAALLPLAHLLLVPFLIKNFSYWGIRLLSLGLLLNLAVMAANGGLMPVSAGAVQAVGRHDPATLEHGQYVPGTENVYLARDDTRLVELSDAIVLRVPGAFTWAVSAGDVLIAFAVAVTLAEIFSRQRRAVGLPALAFEALRNSHRRLTDV
jgi:hypothetical protein